MTGLGKRVGQSGLVLRVGEAKTGIIEGEDVPRVEGLRENDAPPRVRPQGREKMPRELELGRLPYEAEVARPPRAWVSPRLVRVPRLSPRLPLESVLVWLPPWLPQVWKWYSGSRFSKGRP